MQRLKTGSRVHEVREVDRKRRSGTGPVGRQIQENGTHIYRSGISYMGLSKFITIQRSEGCLPHFHSGVNKV